MTESLALAYAEAVNEEVHDLFAAGADIVQLDEPWLQARAEAARRYGVKAINRALAGARGTTALHLCFGYAALVKDKPASGYSFLAELENSAANQISIEAAQPKIDLGVLRALRSKTVLVGVLDLNDRNVETPHQVATRIRAALDVVPLERLVVTPDCGMKYLPRDCRVRQAQGARRGRRARARRALRATGTQKEKPGRLQGPGLSPVARAYMLGIRKDPSPSPLQNVRRNCTGT